MASSQRNGEMKFSINNKLKCFIKTLLQLYSEERKNCIVQRIRLGAMFFSADEHIQRLLLILVLAKNVCISIGIKLSSYWHREQISTLNILYIYLSAFSIFFCFFICLFIALNVDDRIYVCIYSRDVSTKGKKKIHIWIECRAHLLQRSLYTA